MRRRAGTRSRRTSCTPWLTIRTGYLGVACRPSSEADFSYGRCFWGSINSCGAGNVGCGKVWRATLRHEVGHSLGIQHSPQFGGDPDRGFYPGAVGYTPEDHGGNFGTVMGGNTLPRFSTSSETFDFGNTGTWWWENQGSTKPRPHCCMA